MAQLHGALKAVCHKRQAHHGVGLGRKPEHGLVVPPVGVALAPAAGVKARQQRASAAGGAARGRRAGPPAAVRLAETAAAELGVAVVVVSAAVAVFVDVIEVLARRLLVGLVGLVEPKPVVQRAAASAKVPITAPSPSRECLRAC